MSLSNLEPLDSSTIRATKTIQAACRVAAYLHANPRWSLHITPNEVDLTYFIVMNYSEPGQTITRSSGVSIHTARNVVPNQFSFPKTWMTHKKRAQKGVRPFFIDARKIFMTDAFLDWKKQVFSISILDLPNELLQLIAALLPAKPLARICRLNRSLSNVMGSELWRPLHRVLMALEWSLYHCNLTVYEKAVERLSKIPESMGNKPTWKLFPEINTDNMHMLEAMALKGGVLGRIYRQFLLDTLLDNVEDMDGLKKPRHLSVEEVLKQGADPNHFSDGGFLRKLNLGPIPILLIAICGSAHVCAEILGQQPHWNMHTFTRDTRTKTGSVNNVSLLLEYGADPNTHISQMSALHVALSLCSSMCKSHIVRELIKYGANANKINFRGETPLHMALGRNRCVRSHSHCQSTISALLQAPGIDLDVRDGNGRTPLSIAASFNRVSSVWFVRRVLENSDVDINSQDNRGKTVLYHSVENRNTKVANMLLSESHINPNLNPAYLPLFFAVCNRMTNMVKCLLSTKATDPNRKDSNGRLALTLPTTKDIIKLLIEAGAELDIPDSTGLTARETISLAGIDLEEVMRARKRRRIK